MATEAIACAPLCMEEAFTSLRFLYLKLRIIPEQTLKLPSKNKGNTLRGAFGIAFRHLVCVPQCHTARTCPLKEACPYKGVFEPAPPAGMDRLSKNRDTPRPFVFRPPITSKNTYMPGESFEFGLVLLGRSVDYLPYFVMAFRDITRQGFGLNRAPCVLEEVRVADLAEAALGTRNTSVYQAPDELFHVPKPLNLVDWVNSRLRKQALSASGDSVVCNETSWEHTIIVNFLTPTSLKSEERVVREPEFQQLFKRVRDRVNALSTFYGSGPIEADFKDLGKRSEQVRTLDTSVAWQERSRRSSRTHQRHELSGFVGNCTYEGDLREFLPWLIAGEMVHVGRHTAWGNGLYELHQERQ